MNFKPIPNKFEYLNWQEIECVAKNKRSTVIWPFGAVEQHGPHLPLATDSIFVDEIISEVFKLISADIPLKKLPTQYIGFSPEHKGFAGTISLSSNLITSMIKEVGGQLSEMGFKRLILINGHGGQISLLNTAARELRSFSPGMSVFPCFLWSGVYGLSELLLKATPLCLIAIGLSFCFKSNNWNIGAEGQLTFGAIVGGGVALLQGS